MNWHRASVATRWLLAGALAVWTVRQAALAGTTAELAAGALHGFFALAGLLAATLLAAPELAGWALAPFHRLIDAVLLPRESGLPPVDYRLAHYYRQQMRYEDACEEYLKIIHYHPKEGLAYLEGIDAAGQAGRPELAAKFYRLGRRTFRSPQTRRRLQAALDASQVPRELPEEEEEEMGEPPDDLTH